MQHNDELIIVEDETGMAVSQSVMAVSQHEVCGDLSQLICTDTDGLAAAKQRFP